MESFKARKPSTKKKTAAANKLAEISEADREMLAKDTHLIVGLRINDGPSERANRLIAHEQHGAFGPGDIVEQVVLDAATGTHP